MTRVLCVAEKPSIAKALAQALGGGAVRSSPSGNPYIWNYEIAYQSPVWNACEMVVTSVSGHLTDLSFLPPFDRFDTDAVQLFSAPIKTFVPEAHRHAAENIRQLSRNATHLYVWTDCDREGEHIGSEVADVARGANSRLQVFRAHFNNTEAGHLRAAAARPQRLDAHAVAAVNVRRELDLRSGFALTRLQTQLYRAAFGGDFLARAVQYGSCQFPTLGFVVERWLRVERHVPEKFWTIEASAVGTPPEGTTPEGTDSKGTASKGTASKGGTRGTKAKDGAVALTWERNRVTDETAALAHYERALRAAAPHNAFRVTRVTHRPTSRLKPLPLTTVALQKKAAQSLKLSAKTIMDHAEKLYNDGFVSYPRTETDRFDPAIDLRKLVDKQARGGAPFADYAQSLLADGAATGNAARAAGTGNTFEAPRQGKNDDKAHPPIHPVQAATRAAFSDADRWRVYDFIARSFLAACSRDARGSHAAATLDFGGERFGVSGDVVRERNFLDVYPFQQWTTKTLPDWREGDRPACAGFFLRDGATKPPALLTEPELIARMDTSGIGTDATMAEHIAKIVDRVYVVRRGEHFAPTPLGVALVLSYEKLDLECSLTQPWLRRETERLVAAVAAGTQAPSDVLGRLVAKYVKVFRQTHARRAQLMQEADAHLRPSLATQTYLQRNADAGREAASGAAQGARGGARGAGSRGGASTTSRGTTSRGTARGSTARGRSSASRGARARGRPTRQRSRSPPRIRIVDA